MPTIFLRIAWMKGYKGVTKFDKPKGAGSHIEEYEDGGEVCNFYPINGNYYGYVRVGGGKNISIERLNATKKDEFIKKVTVVFFATDGERGGQYIVGWYKNAILYRQPQKLKENSRQNHYSYQGVSSVKDSKLIKVEDRRFRIPEKGKGGPGQSNVWYAEEYSNKSFLAEVEKYIASPDDYIFRRPKRNPTGTPWQKNIELRKQVENTAMRVVADYFEKSGYNIDYVQNQNLGWDLEAKLDALTLLLEVKGLSGDFTTIEFTHNEYTNAKRNKRHYRICIVSNALDKKRQTLDIYYYEKMKWINNKSEVLNVQELIAARFTSK